MNDREKAARAALHEYGVRIGKRGGEHVDTAGEGSEKKDRRYFRNLKESVNLFRKGR